MNYKALQRYAGLYLYYLDTNEEISMDKIQECALGFLRLVNSVSYVFHVANRYVRIIRLDFMASDFYHLAGLQYLTDINIPKNKKNTISWILDRRRPITDEYLAQSLFYKGRHDDEKDIENRIANLRFLEQYLDEKNLIRIYSPKDGPSNSSFIQCDYIIESQLKNSNTTVYIFLKHRNGIVSSCGIISFIVKKNVTYGGQKLYWMVKDKIVNGTRNTLFQNPRYTLEQKSENESDLNLKEHTHSAQGS